MKRFLVAGCWLGAAVGCLVAISATRGVSGPLSAMAVALAPLVAVALVATLVLAAVLRKQLLVGVTLVVLVWGVFIASSTYTDVDGQPHSRSPLPAELSSAQASEGDALVVVSSNVRAGNDELAELIAGLQDQNPDVIVLQEIGDDELDLIRTTDLAQSHPYEVVDPRPGYFGGAVFSRWPLVGQVEQIGGYPMIVATIETPAGPVDVVNVHVAPPISTQSYGLWEAQLDELFDRLSAAETPLVVLGDFNATPQHQELRRLASVTSTRGMGAFASYPRLRLVPPVISLDHAFATGGVCIERVDALPDNAGSDHRALKAILHYSYRCPHEVSRLD